MSTDPQLSTRIVETVADALSVTSTDLPPLGETISAEALDQLFTPTAPVGAHVVFPYHGVWVLVHANGAVDVFSEFKASSTTSTPNTDEKMVILADSDTRVEFRGGDLPQVHEIVDDATDGEEAWEELMELKGE